MSASIFDTGRKGDLEVYFEHLSKPNSQRVQPALRLRNPVQKRNFIIFMDDAHEWDTRPESGNGPRAIALAIEAAQKLYNESVPSRATVMRVLEAVYEWTEDLVHMPPRTIQTPQELAQAMERDRLFLTVNGTPLVDAR